MERNEPDKAEGHVEPVTELVEELREQLEAIRNLANEAGLAAACVLGDPSYDMLSDIIAAAAKALRSGDQGKLADLAKVARSQLDLEHLPRNRQVERLLEILREKSEAPEVGEALEKREVREARRLADVFVDALIGLGDDFGDIRNLLDLTSDDLEARRPRIAADLERQLDFGGGFTRDKDALGTLRALFRAAGMSTKDAEALTDFERKRRNTKLVRRLEAARPKVPPAR